MKKFLSILALTCSGYTSAAYECSSIMPRAISADRYSLINNGSEVLDKQTKLVWQRCLLGQNWNGSECLGAPENLTWSKALVLVKNTNVWRIPDVKELESITEYTCHPMLDAVFANINTNMINNTVYWTSTPNINNAKEVWVVNFSAYSGEIVAVSAKVYMYPTRVVRNAP